MRLREVKLLDLGHTASNGAGIQPKFALHQSLGFIAAAPYFNTYLGILEIYIIFRTNLTKSELELFKAGAEGW